MDDRPQLNAINRYLNRKMEVSVIEGLEPKKTYVPSENKGNGRGRGRGRANGGGNGQGRGRSAGGYAGKPSGAPQSRRTSSDSSNATGQRASNDSGYQGKPRDSSGKPNDRFGGKPYQGKRTGGPSRGDSTSAPRGERAATGRGRPSGSQGRPASRSGAGSAGQGRPAGNNRNKNS